MEASFLVLGLRAQLAGGRKQLTVILVLLVHAEDAHNVLVH
jgi:hypothetical protein